MKNIHILPTDKPSRLYKNLLTDKLFILENSFMDVSECNREYQNIYITSDEEINQQTEPCWCINTIKNTWDDDLIYYQGSMPQYHFKGFKKIILTTVKDLIKDDVQAIDDEFLEWFVKNPNCEEIGVKKYENNKYWTYEKIIPKEEPKQRLEKYSERFDNKDNEIVEGIFNPETWGNRLVDDVPKQETLEEVAEKYVNSFEFGIAHPRRVCKNAFINGAKWQQERSYSEEDMNQYSDYVLMCSAEKTLKIPLPPNEWFEQFKKK